MKININLNLLNRPYKMFWYHAMVYTADIVDGLTGLILLPFGLCGTMFGLKADTLYLDHCEALLKEETHEPTKRKQK